MSAEVELILAQRTGIDTTQYQRFTKIKDSTINGLNWLETNADIFSSKPTYLEFHLVAMRGHLANYNFADLNYPDLRNKVKSFSLLEFIRQSKP